MQGNPHYQPNYEEYYHEPIWLDKVSDREYWHDYENHARKVARDAGPLLPGLAVIAPLAAVAYSGYRDRQIAKESARAERAKKWYEKEQAVEKATQKKLAALEKAVKKEALAAEKAERKQLLAAEKAERKQLLSIEKAEERKRLRDAIIDLKRIGTDQPSQQEPIILPQEIPEYEDNIASKYSTPIRSRSRSAGREIDPPPEFNIELAQPISMLPGRNFNMPALNQQAEAVKNAIAINGFRAVMNSQPMKDNYPKIMEILSDPHQALISGEPFPKPLLDYLSPDTRNQYAERRADAKREKRREKQAGKRAQTATLREEKRAREVERKEHAARRKQTTTQELLAPKPRDTGVIRQARVPRKRII